MARLSVIPPPLRRSARGAGRLGAVPGGHGDRRAARPVFLARWERACLSAAEVVEALTEAAAVAATVAAAAAATTTSEAEGAAVSAAAAAAAAVSAAAAAEADSGEGVAAAALTKARTKDPQNTSSVCRFPSSAYLGAGQG